MEIKKIKEDCDRTIKTLEQRISKCDELYHQYIDLKDQFEIMKNKLKATKDAIDIQKQRLIYGTPPSPPKKQKNKTVRIKESPPKIKEIEKEGKGLKVKPVKSWQKFLSDHAGKGYTREELSKMYKKL